MEFNDLIKLRHSVRSYDAARENEFSNETALELVAAALEAPSWKNCEATRWHFAISAEAKKAICEKALPPFNAGNAQGSVALVVQTFVQKKAGFKLREPDPETQTNELGDTWGAYDAGIAAAHLMLAAKNRGLDSLVMGIRDAAVLRELLSIPENETILAVISLGWAAADVTLEKPPRKTPADVAKLS